MWRQTDGNKEQANHAEALSVAVAAMQNNMASLRSENRAHQVENSQLRARELEIQSALQAEQSYCRDDERSKNSANTSSDKISVLTEAISELAKEVRSVKTTGGDQNGGTGKGRKCCCCWKCGGDPTHWTRKCRFLSKEQKQECRDADGIDRMGGNEKCAERVSKYEGDF